MCHFILFTVLWTIIIFESCCVGSTGNGIAVNKTDLIKILGGMEVHIKKYPFSVSIQLHFVSDGVDESYHYCGGSLVRADWVLTSAFCLLYEDEDLSTENEEIFRVRDPNRLSVVAGLSDVKWIPLDDNHRIAVLSTLANKYYDPPSNTENIGLMKLVSKFPMTKNIQLVSLADLTYYDTFIPTSCSTLGWGSTSRKPKQKSWDAGTPDGSMTESKVVSHYRVEGDERNLKFTVVELISYEKCRDWFGTFWTRLYVSKLYQICVEALEENGVFMGESGAPLMCGGLQVGLLSSLDGRKEADLFYPSVYTRIDFYLDWINATISTANALQTSRGSWWMNYAIMLALAVALKQIIIMK